MMKNEKGMTLLALIIIIVVLFLLLVIFFVSAIFQRNNSNKKGQVNDEFKIQEISSFKELDAKTGDEKYTREDMLSLLQMGKKAKNYSISYDNENKTVSRYVLNDEYFMKIDKVDYYFNKDTEERTIINHENKTIVITPLIDNIEELQDSYIESYMNILKDNEYEYEFLKEEKYNNFDCVVIQLKKSGKIHDFGYWGKTSLLGKIVKMHNTCELWIDKESGLIALINTTMKAGLQKEEMKIDTNLSVGTVTEDIFEIGEFSDYEVYK